MAIFGGYTPPDCFLLFTIGLKTNPNSVLKTNLTNKELL